MATLARASRRDAVRYVVNGEFNQAVLFFEDGSYLQFEHTSRSNRWAKASGAPSCADRYCKALRGFRLNAKHLQLYFGDDSDVEFTLGDDEGRKLEEVVRANPLYGFGDWWPIGARFTHFMSDAIVSEWRTLTGNSGNLSPIIEYAQHYTAVVYRRVLAASVVEDFVDPKPTMMLQSGEFDALSYAFFRSAFERIATFEHAYHGPVILERRGFTKRVGRSFYALLHDHLDLELPAGLSNGSDFDRLRAALCSVGDFLCDEGYLRDHFSFRFDVDVEYAGHAIHQPQGEFLERLAHGQPAYALYEMGYPVILPSAVYLYQTVGEAQHHSSRTMEELFDRIGYHARETDDFDPTGFPPDRVIELWEIRRAT